MFSSVIPDLPTAHVPVPRYPLFRKQWSPPSVQDHSDRRHRKPVLLLPFSPLLPDIHYIRAQKTYLDEYAQIISLPHDFHRKHWSGLLCLRSVLQTLHNHPDACLLPRNHRRSYALRSGILFQQPGALHPVSLRKILHGFLMNLHIHRCGDSVTGKGTGWTAIHVPHEHLPYRIRHVSPFQLPCHNILSIHESSLSAFRKHAVHPAEFLHSVHKPLYLLWCLHQYLWFHRTCHHVTAQYLPVHHDVWYLSPAWSVTVIM